MNYKKMVNALHETRSRTYSLQEALNEPRRWCAYWMLYNTPEATDGSVCYDKWISYVTYIRSKPE